MHDLEPVTSPMDSVSASGKSPQTPSFERGELVRKLALPVSEQFVGARTVSSGPLHNRLHCLRRVKGAEPAGVAQAPLEKDDKALIRRCRHAH